MKNILVIGGAGYIGFHMCKYLVQYGYRPIVLDNFISGHRQAVKYGSLIEGEMGNPQVLKQIFQTHHIAAVMHFMVSNNFTGFLVPHGDINALQTIIIQLLKNRTRLKKMAIDCRRIALEKCSQEIQVRKYIELYEKVLTC